MKPWRAVGYFQYLYCSERSKEKAKTLALDFIVRNEDDPERCQIRCDHIAWMRGVTTRDQLAFGHASELTQEMFDQKDQIGIWFHTDKQYYVSEEDFAATMVEESDASEEGS